MTKVPKIQRMVSKVFGKHPSTRVKPEEAVVIGSAIQAALIMEDQREISGDMIPLSIGFETAKGSSPRSFQGTPESLQSGWCGCLYGALMENPCV